MHLPTRRLTAVACAAALHAAHAQTPAPDPTVMPTLTVTATLAEQDARTAPATVSVIGRDELQQRNAIDLLEALRDLPGFTYSPRQVGGRKTIALRGLEGKHTLTLIDGRRISPTDDVVGHSDYQYGWLPVSAIERIEVIRGPMSALYGSEALGGVINIITRKAMDRWAGSASLSGTVTEGESGAGGGASVFATGPLAKGLLLRVNAEWSRTDPVADPEDPRHSEIEGRENRTAGLGLVLQLAPGQHLEGGWTAARELRLYDSVSGTRAYTNRYDVDRDHAHLTWTGRWGGTRSQLRVYRSAIDVLNARTNGVAPTRPQHLQDEVIDGHVGLRLGAHQLTVGGEWRREELVNAGLTGGRDDATHKALFLQDELPLGSHAMLTAGLRVDHHQRFGTEASPRAYLVWEPTKALVVKGGWGHAFKAPTLKQISPNYVGAEGPHTFLGNADVKPESADSAEVSVDWTQGAWNLRGSLFRTDVKDLITTRLLSVAGTRRTFIYDNINRARISGLEAGLRWSIVPALTASLDLTLLRAKDRSTGKDLADRPETSAATQLAWRGGDGWSARVGGAYTGAQTDSTGVRLPSYWLWNAGLGKRLSAHLGLRAGVENLGNLRLAERSASFGHAERARRVFVSLAAEL